MVAVFICIAGWQLGRRTIDTLTDTAPAGVSERVAAIARQVSGVVAVERVRARPAGAVLFVELGVAVSRTLPLDRVTAIKQQLTAAIRIELSPSAEVTITTEARALDNETVRERVMVIARDLGLAIHHVAVQTIAADLSVSTDLLRSRLPIRSPPRTKSQPGSNRRCATSLARTSRSKPTSSRCLPMCCPAATPPSASAKCLTHYRRLPSKSPDLTEIHDVRVRETPDGEIVNFHCRVDPALSVAAVHDLVDALERRLRQHSRHPAGHRSRARPRTEPTITVALSIGAQSLYITAHHAHRRTPPRPPARLPPARLAHRNRRSRRIADPTATTVRAKLKIKPNAAGTPAPLVLDGDELKLRSLVLDGKPLAPENFVVTPDRLTIAQVPNRPFELDIETVIDPTGNTQLMGNFIAPARLFHQCEAEGFRRITYSLDRPDVMAIYTTRIEADKKARQSSSPTATLSGMAMWPARRGISRYGTTRFRNRAYLVCAGRRQSRLRRRQLHHDVRSSGQARHLRRTRQGGSLRLRHG